MPPAAPPLWRGRLRRACRSPHPLAVARPAARATGPQAAPYAASRAPRTQEARPRRFSPPLLVGSRVEALDRLGDLGSLLDDDPVVVALDHGLDVRDFVGRNDEERQRGLTNILVLGLRERDVLSASCVGALAEVQLGLRVAVALLPAGRAFVGGTEHGLVLGQSLLPRASCHVAQVSRFPDRGFVQSRTS